jgi:predicted Rossmann fold nucleotide-binding protein DprA/Smf involved in DNA uptake
VTRRELALSLALTPGVGGVSVHQILSSLARQGVAPEEVFKLSPEGLQEGFGLKSGTAKSISGRSEECLSRVAAMQERLQALGVTLISAADGFYDERLKNMLHEPPNMLFLYGNQKLLRAKTFCVLSSRNTSPAGLDQIETLAEEGVLKGEVVISSDNRPEYQRAALVPLRWGAPRILCLDRGLFEVLGPDLKQEPFRAARLWRYEFDANTDLAISPFHPEAKFAGVNNQVRDWLVAELSQRLDLVEIAPGGNMEKIAKAAISAGRSVRVSDRCVIYRRLQDAGAGVIPAV